MESLVAKGWDQYQLLDSGDGLRLEQLGGVSLVRPEPNALWPKSSPDLPEWESPDGRYVGKGGKGEWQLNRPGLSGGWNLAYGPAVFRVKPTAFRHTGLFPEQQPQWEWLQEQIGRMRKKKKEVKVLNLFAYTGAMSVLAAQAGAKVCHVDAAPGSINWAKENAKLSGLPEDAIRWMFDDALKFIRREARRENAYDIILMDPPVFGRGPRGEIWRLEERISELASLSRQLVSGPEAAVWVNCYATVLYPEAVARLWESACPEQKWQAGTLSLLEKSSGKRLPTGYFVHT